MTNPAIESAIEKAKKFMDGNYSLYLDGHLSDEELNELFEQVYDAGVASVMPSLRSDISADNMHKFIGMKDGVRQPKPVGLDEAIKKIIEDGWEFDPEEKYECIINWKIDVLKAILQAFGAGLQPQWHNCPADLNEIEKIAMGLDLHDAILVKDAKCNEAVFTKRLGDYGEYIQVSEIVSVGNHLKAPCRYYVIPAPPVAESEGV